MSFIWMICRQFYWKRDKKWFCSVWCVDCEWYLLHETKVILCCMVCWLWVVPSARDKSDFVLYGVLTEWYLLHETKVILCCMMCWLSGTFCTRQKWFCAVWCVDCEWYLLHETKVILCCMACWLWVVPSARDKSDFVLYGVLTVSGTFCTRQKWFCAVWRVDCEWYLLHETKSDFVLYDVLTEWYLLHETKVILCCMVCWLWVVPSARDKSDFVLYGVLTVSGTFCTRQKWFCAVCRADCEWYLLHETKVILCCMPCWLWVVPSARDKSDFVLYGVLTVSGTFCTRQKWFCAVCRADCEWYLLHETKVILCCMPCWLWVVPSAWDKKWFCAVCRADCEWYLLHETKVILFCLVCWLWVVPSARDKKWFCAVWCVDCKWYLLHETKVILCCMPCWL